MFKFAQQMLMIDTVKRPRKIGIDNVNLLMGIYYLVEDLSF